MGSIGEAVRGAVALVAGADPALVRIVALSLAVSLSAVLLATLFGLPVGASPEDVRSTYFMLARKLHPDRLAAIGIDDDDRQAQRLMACINEAFTVLNDPARREEYLSILNRGGEAAIRAEEQKADEIAMKVMRAEEEFRQGEMALRRDQLDVALEHFKAAQAVFDQLRKEEPGSKIVLLDAADTHDRLGDLLRLDGPIDEAFDQYMAGKNDREQAASQGNGKVSDEVLALSTSHFKLASVFQNRGESGGAVDEYKHALRLRDTLLESQPDHVRYQEAVLEVLRELAELERQLGEEKDAVAAYRRAVPLSRALVQRDPTNTEWQYQRGNLLSDFGFTLVDTGQFAEGLEQIQASVEVLQDLVARDAKSARYAIALSRSNTRAGDALIYLGRTGDGVAQYRYALELRQELIDQDAKSVAYRRSIAWSYSKLAKAFTLEADPAHALEAHEQSLAIRQQLVAESPSQGGFKNELAASEAELGRLLATKDAKRADELIKDALTRARMLVAGDMINNEWKETLVQGLLAQAEAARARGDVATHTASLTEARGIADEAMNKSPGNVHWPGYVAEIAAGLGDSKRAIPLEKIGAVLDEAMERVRLIIEELCK